MEFNLQPTLENELVRIQPLKETDFDSLFTIASDPLIWEQHPNKDRYKKEVFLDFFKGAMDSKSAFLIIDKKTEKPIGSSRYYELDLEKSSVAIGYTFIGRTHWGTNYNREIKDLMVNHAFEFVDKVLLHIGAGNIRSQKATEKLGAKKIREIELEYPGEVNKLNFEYQIRKEDWK